MFSIIRIFYILCFCSHRRVINFLQFGVYHSKNGHQISSPDIPIFSENAAKPEFSILKTTEKGFQSAEIRH